jgi:hypothetical protein
MSTDVACCPRGSSFGKGLKCFDTWELVRLHNFALIRGQNILETHRRQKSTEINYPSSVTAITHRDQNKMMLDRTKKKKLNSADCVCERTIATELPPLVVKVSVIFWG